MEARAGPRHELLQHGYEAWREDHLPGAEWAGEVAEVLMTRAPAHSGTHTEEWITVDAISVSVLTSGSHTLLFQYIT